MKKEFIILIPIILLNVLGIYYLQDSYQIKQILWLILGLITFLGMTKIKEKHLFKISIFLYLLVLILLIVVLFFPYTNGSRGWFKFGSIYFQPAELMKFCLIFLTISLISKQIKNKILFLLIYIIPSILTFLEPDTGAVIIYGLIFLYFLPHFFSKKQIIGILILGSTLFIGLTFFYVYQRDKFIDIFSTSIYYRIDRLLSFKNQDNMQVNNALISIAAGKLLYFPEANNDFFFAYLVSNNFINFFIILSCYFLILLILTISKRKYAFLVAFLIFCQIIINIGMNLRLLPVIGLPLPFLSYGGSHTITSFMTLGLVMRKTSNSHNMS